MCPPQLVLAPNLMLSLVGHVMLTAAAALSLTYWICDGKVRPHAVYGVSTMAYVASFLFREQRLVSGNADLEAVSMMMAVGVVFALAASALSMARGRKPMDAVPYLLFAMLFVLVIIAVSAAATAC